MDTRWFVEIDPHCRNVLARHWPGLPIYGDITAIDWSGVEPVDVLAGGFPCQPVSNAGKRLGTEDERWLWPEFARAIRTLRPRYVLVENVAALLGRGFEHVITDLAALGYDAEWDCIPAAAVGAPHLRDRLWLVAYPDGGGRWTSGEPRNGRAMGGWRDDSDSASAATNGRVVAYADSDTRQEGRARHASQESRGRHADRGGERQTMADAYRVGCQGKRGSGIFNSIGPASRRDADRRSGASVPYSIFAGLEGHERGVVALQEFRRSHADPAGSGWWSAEPDVGRVADGIPHRVDRLRSLGNAVVPQVVEWIGRRIVAFDEEREVTEAA